MLQRSQQMYLLLPQSPFILKSSGGGLCQGNDGLHVAWGDYYTFHLSNRSSRIVEVIPFLR